MTNEFGAYKDLYIQTSREYLSALNKALLVLEKTPSDEPSIEEIFRSAHSLKSQSAAMEYVSTAYLCHIIEDVFYEVKQKRLELTSNVADLLFEAFDQLKNSIDSIESANKEIDSSDLSQKLKNLTGVKTEGIGKSVRSEKQPSTNTQPQIVNKTIPVKVKILDDLLNLVEELMLTKHDEYSAKIISNLQYKLMQARAVSVGLVFEHFPRTIRDLSKAENKEIELKIEGADLELDRTIIDRLDEPLIHILRNAVSHGIAKSGTITISAKSEKDYAVISIKDNGVGIDWERLAEKAGKKLSDIDPKNKQDLLFAGISTAEKVTEISGRGVGMKIVKKMIQDFGGEIEIISEKNSGTTINLKLPLTLAIIKAVIISIYNEAFAIPSLLIDRVINLRKDNIKLVSDQPTFILDEIEIPIIYLSNILLKNVSQNTQVSKSSLTVVVVWVGQERVGLVVDSLTQTQDIVVKELPKSLKNLKLFSGTTIISGGYPTLVINPIGLAN